MGRRASCIDHFSSPATGTRCRDVSVLRIVWPGAWVSCMALILCFKCYPASLVIDVADNGLASLVYVNVLNHDLLLPLNTGTSGRIFRANATRSFPSKVKKAKTF
jgi:hypothetical protein